jgi:hypothetical protein
LKTKVKEAVWRNPVVVGLEYLNLYKSGQYPTYETLARKYNVTRARICQMINMVKKLPKEISDLFLDRRNSYKLRHITERKLRILTTLKCDKEKMAAFKKLINAKSAVFVFPTDFDLTTEKEHFGDAVKGE